MSSENENRHEIDGEGLWSRLSVVALMVLVLIAVGGLSAVTAMRFSIRGQEVNVPDLAGLPESEARSLLTDSELGFEVAGERFSETVPPGRILEQTPGAGIRVKKDRNVHVLLSLGERRFPVPEVIGSSFRSAQMMLAQRGLAVGTAVYSHTVEGEPSTVVQQAPEAGDAGNDDPNVNVLISLGPLEQYYLMPDLVGQPVQDVILKMRAEGFRLGEVAYREQAAAIPGRVVQQQPQAGFKVSKNDVVLVEVSR